MTDNLIPDVNPTIPIQVMRGGGRRQSQGMQKGGTTPQDIQILRKFHMGEGQTLEDIIDEPTKQNFLKQRKRCMKNSGTLTVLDKNCWAVSRVLRELLLRDIRAENSKTDVIRVHVKPQQSVAIHVIGDDTEYEELELDDEDDDEDKDKDKSVGSENDTMTASSNDDSEASDPRRKSSAETTGDVANAANAALAAAAAAAANVSEDDLESPAIPDLSGISHTDRPSVVETPFQTVTVPSPAATAEVPSPVPAIVPAPAGPTIIENPLRAISTTASSPVPPPPIPTSTVVVQNPARGITPQNKKQPSKNTTKRVRINNRQGNKTQTVVENPLVKLGIVQPRGKQNVSQKKNKTNKPVYTIGNPTLIGMESSKLQSKLDSANPTIQSLESTRQSLNKSITNINRTLGNPRLGSNAKQSLTQTRNTAEKKRKNLNTQLGKLKSKTDAAKRIASISGENARVMFNPLSATRRKGIPGAGTGLQEIETILTKPLGNQPSNEEVNALLSQNGGSQPKRRTRRANRKSKHRH